MSPRILKAHELRRFDRVLIHRDLRGADVATICAVVDASFAGAGLVDVKYQFNAREIPRKIRISREAVFHFLGTFEALRRDAAEVEVDDSATTMRMECWS